MAGEKKKEKKEKNIYYEGIREAIEILTLNLWKKKRKKEKIFFMRAPLAARNIIYLFIY